MKKIYFYIVAMFLCTTIFAQTEKYPRAENTHRIMTYNVRNAKGMDNKTDYKRIANVIESINPDVVALQELDSVTTRSKHEYVLKQIADEARYHYTYGSAIDYNGGKYGVGILSKERAIKSKNIPLPGREEKRTMLLVEFNEYVFICTHWSLTEQDRLNSINIIEAEAKKHNKPVFLAGDLNAEPLSDEIKKLENNWKILSNKKVNTFPSNDPDSCLDYIAAYEPSNTTFSVLESRVIPNHVASDHRPVFVDVRLSAKPEKVMRTKPYLQNPSETGMAVMWITNVPCRSWVEYGTDPNNLKRARTFIEGEMVANNTINKIQLENLTPATKYYYRVCSQEITLYKPYRKEFGDTVYSQVYDFETWNPAKKDFKVLVFSDIHKNFKMFDALCKEVKDVKYDLVIFNGDCIDDAQTESDVVETINYYGEKLNNSNIPSIYMRGNHETRGAYSVLLWNYLDRKGGKSYGAFTFGGSRFVFLDNGEDKPDDHWVYYDMNDFTQHRLNQKSFLESELNSKEFKSAKTKILIHHIPIFGKNQDEYNPCKTLWQDILAKGKFNVSINAHTHMFEYIPAGQDGNVYPVIIGGGNRITNGTVSILEKNDNSLKIKVMESTGKTKLELNL